VKVKKYIVTIVNSVSETSMPYNEFVLYRYNNMLHQDKQLLIVLSKKRPKNVSIPDGLQVCFAGYNLNKIRKIMDSVLNECKEEGMKLVIHQHQPKSAVLFNLSTIFKSYGSKTVFTIHSLFDAYDMKNKLLSIFTFLKASKVTFVSQASFDHYPILFKKFKKSNMSVLKNGVDLNRIDRIVSSNSIIQTNNNKIKTIVYVARMIPIKNHKFLIEVLSQLKNCNLVLIGAEDKDGEIRELINAKKLNSRVKMYGPIPRDAVFKILKESDIYVSPSKVEGLPISVLEAMYVGLPVVISNIQSHLEIGSHNKSIVTLPFDLEIWINKLSELIDMDKSLLEKIGADCKGCAELNFSLDKMLSRFDELYEQL
jgi:glycosyltransferase involved in cell wall biosynthesis